MNWVTILSIALDILCVTIVVSCVIYYMRKGFLSALFSFLATFVVLLLALFAARAMAGPIFEGLFREGLIDRTTEVAAQTGAESLRDILDKVAGILPDFLAKQVTAAIGTDLTAYTGDFSTKLVDNVLAPIILPIIVLVVFLLLFFVLRFIAGKISKVLSKTQKIPVVGPVNSVLGAAAGVLIGVLYCFILYLIITGCESLSPPINITQSSYFATSIAYRLFLGVFPV